MMAEGKERSFFRRSLERVAETGLNKSLLRKIVGILGVALPVVLIVWGVFLVSATLQNSLSDYYSLRTRDAFVGILFVIGWILFSYKGYEKIDGIAGKLAWLFAMGVALFPNSATDWQRIVHFVCAVALFGVLAFFSLALFTKSDKSRTGLKHTIADFRLTGAKKVASMSGAKRIRNRVYVICGWLIVACIILIGLYYAFGQNTVLSDIRPVLWLEAIMIWSFGFAWFVKGDTFWKDKKTSAK